MSYPGAKGQAGVFHRIIGEMPPHDFYVEPFAGSARVFWEKRIAARSILIDADAGAARSLAAAVNAKLDAPGRALVDVVHGDGLKWLQNEGQDILWVDNAVIYCDPPYLLETRRSRRYYRHEMTDEDHATLLSALRSVKARVLLSGYPSELYGATLQDWRCEIYKTRTRGATVTECLWMNFPPVHQLHDWRYAGRNYRQRLGLKRLAARWLARLQAMPARQRGYVLHTIAQRHGELGRTTSEGLAPVGENFPLSPARDGFPG